jgi:hypothetical protein
MTADEIHGLLDAEERPSSGMRIAEMDEDSLASLVARLNLAEDSVIEVEEVSDDSTLVALSADRASVNPPPSRSTGRKGARGAYRERLIARFPDRVPPEWLEALLSRNASFSTLIAALADEGDPGRALALMRRLFEMGADVTRADTFYRLAEIADDALITWVSGIAGVGGPSQVRALATFARGAAPDTVLPLLERLIHRIDGHLMGRESGVSHDIDDPWERALVDILRAKRLRDVPGAGAWLVRMMSKTEYWLTRDDIVEAMASFPSTWSIVETEAVKGLDYAGVPVPGFRKADEIAHALFAANRGGSDAKVTAASIH